MQLHPNNFIQLQVKREVCDKEDIAQIEIPFQPTLGENFGKIF